MPEKRKITKKGYLALGVICAIIALIFLPPIFGLVAIFSGIQLFRKYDEGLGLGIIILGAVCAAIGFIFGALSIVGLWGLFPLFPLETLTTILETCSKIFFVIN